MRGTLTLTLHFLSTVPALALEALLNPHILPSLLLHAPIGTRASWSMSYSLMILLDCTGDTATAEITSIWILDNLSRLLMTTTPAGLPTLISLPWDMDGMRVGEQWEGHMLEREITIRPGCFAAVIRMLVRGVSM